MSTPNGEPAGYGLCWADPVTGVGLVEPMRTEEAHRNRGVASHILVTGLSRLAAHGCQRLKVSSDLGIYLRAGFEPDAQRPRPSGPARQAASRPVAAHGPGLRGATPGLRLREPRPAWRGRHGDCRRTGLS